MKPGASLRQGAPGSPNGAAARDSDSTADTAVDGKAAPEKPDEGAKNADDDAKPPAVRNLDAQRLSVDSASSDSKFFFPNDGTSPPRVDPSTRLPFARAVTEDDEEEEKVDDAVETPAPKKSGAGLQKSADGDEDAKSPAEVSTGSEEEIETPEPAGAKATFADGKKPKGVPKASGAKSPAEVTVNPGDLETPKSAGSLADPATAKKKPWTRKGPGPSASRHRLGVLAQSTREGFVKALLGGDLSAADACLVKAANELKGADGLPIDLELGGSIGTILSQVSKRPGGNQLDDEQREYLTLISWMCNARAGLGVFLSFYKAVKLLVTKTGVTPAAALAKLTPLLPEGSGDGPDALADYDVAKVLSTYIIPALIAESDVSKKARGVLGEFMERLTRENISLAHFKVVEATLFTESTRRSLPGEGAAMVANEGSYFKALSHRKRALFTALASALVKSWAFARSLDEGATKRVLMAITYQHQSTFDDANYLLQENSWSPKVIQLLRRLKRVEFPSSPVLKAQGSANEPPPQEQAAAKQAEQADAPGKAAEADAPSPADKRAAPDAEAPPQAGAKAPPQAAKPPAEEPTEDEAETPQLAEEAAVAEPPAAEPAAAEAVARPLAGILQPVEEAAGADGGRGEGDGMSIRPVVKTQAGDDYRGDRACTNRDQFLCPNPHGWCNAMVPFSTDTYCLKCWLICGYCSDIGVFYSHYRGGGIVTHEGTGRMAGMVVQKPAGGDYKDRGGDPACTNSDRFLCPNPHGCDEMVRFRMGSTYCPRCMLQCGYASGRVFYSHYRGGGLAYHKG